LSQGFNGAATELRELVEKQHPAVSQRDFPGAGLGPTADEAGVAHGVVRRAKGSNPHQSRVRGQEACDRVHGRDLEGLGVGHGRKDGGDATCEHGLAPTGRADHEQVMGARGSDLQRASCALLAFDVGEIERAIEGGSKCSGVGG